MYHISAIQVHDRRWVIPFIIGSILPDLIDKPIGYILLGESIGGGRIYTHGLVFFSLILIAGILLWKYRSHPAGLALAAGILLHQILDQMWLNPNVWYYTLAGPLKTRSVEGYAFALLKIDLSVWSEWALVALIGAGIIVYLLLHRKKALVSKHRKIFQGLLVAIVLIFATLSGIAIRYGLYPVKKMAKTLTPYVGWSRPEEYILAGIIFAIAAYYVWRLYSGLKKSV